MILVVEDDEIARGAMRRLLEASGYDNVAVESAEAALAYIQAGNVPDAALIDWDLPGMSGLDLIRRVRESAPETFTFLVTGAARERIEDAARRFGINYMRKPIDFHHLLRLLPPGLRRGEAKLN